MPQDADNRIRVAEDNLAATEMEVGRYYLEAASNYVAAINRFKTVVSDYQTTAHVEEALDAPDRMLHGARHHQGSAERRRSAWPQLPRIANGTRTPTRCSSRTVWLRAKTASSWLSKAWKAVPNAVARIWPTRETEIS